MAETFFSPTRRVKFSSGATEALYRGWVALGRDLAQTAAEIEVVDWLNERLINGGDGSRAFDVTTPALATPQKLRFLAKLAQKSRSILSQPDHYFQFRGEWCDLATGELHFGLFEGVLWDDDRHARWCTVLAELEEMLTEAGNSLANKMTG